MKNIAIITGASRGMGREFVRLLALRDEIEEIWALARNEEKLKELSMCCDKKIKCIPMDLSETGNIIAFAETLKEADVKVRYLINNAGFAKFCSYGDISIEESLNMINLNISGVVAMGVRYVFHIWKKAATLLISHRRQLFSHYRTRIFTVPRKRL